MQLFHNSELRVNIDVWDTKNDCIKVRAIYTGDKNAFPARKYENNIDLHIMEQKKGQTGNPNGRPKGSPNRVTGTVKEWIASIIDGNRQQFEKDLKSFEPNERIKVISNLFQYVVPKASTGSDDDILTNIKEGINISA